MNTTALLFSVVYGLIYYDMLEFKELKTDVFIKRSTSSQLNYLFVDALHFIDLYHTENPDCSLLECEMCGEKFMIRIRINKYDILSFPVHWFSCQSGVFHDVRPDSRSKVEIEPHFDKHFYLDIKYTLWMELPF